MKIFLEGEAIISDEFVGILEDQQAAKKEKGKKASTTDCEG